MRNWVAGIVVSFGWVTRASAQTAPLDVDLGGGEHLDLVLVHAGTFEQGSPPDEKDHAPDEAQRKVTLTTDFYMARTPVTRGQFQAFVTATAYRTEAEKGASGGTGWDGTKLVQKKEFNWKNPGFKQTSTDPVVIVTYDDALAFARWFEGKGGHTVSLPTEAQYEYAMRGGKSSPFYAEDPLAIGWFKANAGVGTRPVGQKLPNAYGLFDMSGNVYEWCRDWYGPYSGGGTDPETTQPPSGDTARRVLRGGSWSKGPEHGRSAARWRNTPGSRNADNGFRVVANVAALIVVNENGTPVPQPSVAAPAPPPADGKLPLGTLGLAGAGVAGLGAALYFALKKRGVKTTPSEDGFTIEGDFPPGTLAKWSAIVRGANIGDTVTLEGARTFVYTGGLPSAIRIESITYPEGPRGDGGYRGRPPTPYVPPTQPRYMQPSQQPIFLPPDPPARPIDDDPPFRGFPPAY